MMVHAQFITMATMIVSGIYLGMALETYRRLSVWWRHHIIFVYLFEIIFWMSQTILLFILLYKRNYGELRLYVFLACLLGFSMYVVLFKKMYQQILEVIIQVIVTIIRWIMNVITFLIIRPLGWLIYLIISLVKYVLLISYRLIIFVLKLLYIPIRMIKNVIYSLLPETFIKKSSQFIVKCSTMLNKSILKIRNFFKW